MRNVEDQAAIQHKEDEEVETKLNGNRSLHIPHHSTRKRRKLKESSTQTIESGIYHVPEPMTAIMTAAPTTPKSPKKRKKKKGLPLSFQGIVKGYYKGRKMTLRMLLLFITEVYIEKVHVDEACDAEDRPRPTKTVPP